MARFVVTTFGCQMNKHDSLRIEEVLRGAGDEPVSSVADADLVVLNTCSVRDKAEQKIRSEVGRLAVLKRRRPDLMVVVAGCMARQHGKKLIQSMPELDLVIGPDNIVELPELVAAIRLGGPPQVRTDLVLDPPTFLTAPTVAGGQPTAFVTTMKGCDERCTYCVVPHTRGPERYRPSDEVIDEIRKLVAAEVREVTLLGQTVNRYRDPARHLGPAPGATTDDPDESEFAALLWAIAEQVPELKRLRYESPHPRHLTPALIEAHAGLAFLPRHLHLPVQSGSDRLLKRMIRRHTRADYLERIAQVRERLPDVTISTDVIVGFPGETEADFLQTLSLLEEVPCVGVFGFMYSPRPGTAALRFGDDVPEADKSARLQRLFEVSERLLAAHLEALVGSTQHVLVEGPSKTRAENLTGRSERNEIVHIAEATELDLRGKVVAVEIVEAYKHSLLGRLTEEDN
ncbi:MAG: tRNA (N6-isopentenyl adenosine(37)-C2)-methylthiotransferase MiaB [Deltaproteobacteria bacterium]|nr:tRNA (N6-isopentenyl adenosine(37)-C2)-methylthiotransferase MiaB [Deltaproteobacteria bacterium]